jgi:predicted dehydrogenase
MKRYRIGVIGLGMGKSHIEGFQSHPAAEVVAIADSDKERLAAVAEKYAIPATYTDARKMLAGEKLDIVSVVTPNKFHRELTIAALEAGCHVLCEKPMAMNAAEAEDMLAAARKHDRRLMINFSFRFRPQSYAMKKLVEAGELGNIYFGRTVWLRRRGMPGFGGWFGTKSLAGGGPLIDLGVHRLDLALWLMGYPEPEWVLAGACSPIASEIAARKGVPYNVEDFATAMIRFKNGAMLELEASWAGNIKENELMETRLLGDKGGLHQYNLNGTYEFDVEFYRELAGCQYDSKLHPPVPECHNAQYSLMEAIVHDQPTPVPAEQGLAVMRLLDAIYQSAASGQPVKLG